ncbi:MAG TPA: hypothetical protein VGD64_08320 [Acidisarcina sp.]
MKAVNKFAGRLALAIAAALLPASLAHGQNSAPPQANSAVASPPPASAPDAKSGKTRISPEQARQLFNSVDEILKFASADTGLPIKHQVKRRLINRDEVTKYVVAKFNDDEDARRMQRSEIVLKKFGLLDHDFQLRPFLTSLLTEQIAGYYDNKTKTVNLLDWIDGPSQEPVLAHELTHALQDQHVDLEKWGDKTLSSVARNVTEDNQHLATDEADSARDAVLEGQAMAVFIDRSLQPTGRTLLTAPDLVEGMKDSMGDSSGSPVMERAPLLLQQSLLFPYRDGLTFEQAVLTESGKNGAFAGVLDRPPSTSFEILNPAAYQREQKVPLLTMPDVHTLLHQDYDPYDVGVIGELDVRMLTELFAGPEVSAALTPEWDGGLYYAAQRKSAHTPQEKASTASLSLVYVSRWQTAAAASRFATIYSDELGRKYSRVSRDHQTEARESSNSDSNADTTEDAGPVRTATGNERIYKTNEGPVLVVVNGREVFISESFDLTTARKLQVLLLGAQEDESMSTASLTHVPLSLSRRNYPNTPLTGSMVHWIAGCGLMKAALPH